MTSTRSIASMTLALVFSAHCARTPEDVFPLLGPPPLSMTELTTAERTRLQAAIAADTSSFRIETRPILFQIRQVGDLDRQQRSTYHIDRPFRIRVLALGEVLDGVLVDRGWIENSDTGEIVWAMTLDNTVPAGGDRRNVGADEIRQLGPGRYTLRYETNERHSHDAWTATPPPLAELYGITAFVMRGD